MMLRWSAPWVLLLLPPLAAVALALWRRRVQRPRMIFSSLALLASARPTLRMRLLRLPLLLTLVACMLLVGALAGPKVFSRDASNPSEGIDIMLVIDVSQSMAALDFQPNRLERAKAVVKDFVGSRPDDRIGLVIFGRDAFALTPLTNDAEALEGFIDRIDFDLVSGDRTAIGMGLANAVNQLRKIETNPGAAHAKSRVVILLTDGENNAGRIDPITAAENIAKPFGVRVYTIGVGSVGGFVDIPVQVAPNRPPQIQKMRSNLDVEQLTKIAGITGGQFFHATDDQSLEKIYSQIDKMEKTVVELSETHHYDELAHYLIFPAALFLLLALLLESTWLRTFP
jgi:Ca-activated chloride channel family protein